ncbi:MAG: TetR family transcriptional regulator [Candidatus Bathyarchaeia archaeon]|jgi:TetR/AcrR family tetracycline transcriptional repressor
MKTRKTKTPHIQPDAVIKAALEILDAEGLENVTLRRIAAKLNVQAPALYWHFKNKQDLTDDMAQAILSNAKLDNFTAPTDINNWPTWLADLMHCLRNALIAYRDGGRVVAGATYGRAYTLEKIMVGVTRFLEKAGFDKLNAGLAAGTTIDYVWGFVIEEQAGIEPPQDVQSIGTNSEDDAFLSAIMEEYHKLTPTEIFDWGLQAIITGLKAARNNANLPGPPPA